MSEYEKYQLYDCVMNYAESMLLCIDDDLDDIHMDITVPFNITYKYGIIESIIPSDDVLKHIRYHDCSLNSKYKKSSRYDLLIKYVCKIAPKEDMRYDHKTTINNYGIPVPIVFEDCEAKLNYKVFDMSRF